MCNDIGRQNTVQHSSVAKSMLKCHHNLSMNMCKVSNLIWLQNPKMHPLEKAQECTPQPPRKGSNNNPVRLKQFSR